MSYLVDLLGRYSNRGEQLSRLRALEATLAKMPVRVEQPDTRKHTWHRLSRRLPPETLDAIVTAYVGGATTRAVAERYDVNKTSVLGLLRERGVPVRPRGGNYDR